MTAQADHIVLVTGGAGYIGSTLIGLLLRQGYRVRTIDNLSYGGEALLPYWSAPGFEFVAGDIRRADDMDRALENVDAVIHLAAIVGDKACRENPVLATEVNLKASEMLCEKALERGVKRFIFASTCSNYGKTGSQTSDGAVDTFVDETSPLQPISLYAELKVRFEKYLLEMETPQLAPTCLRFATAYGLSPRPRFDLTLNEFVRELLMGRKLEVYGERFWRPYCHVTDLARACLTVLCAETSKVAYRAFNVGDTSENYQKKKLLELILAELPDKRDKVVYVHQEEDPRDYRVNCDKLHRELGFSVTRRVPDGIREIIFGITSGLIRNPDDVRYRNA
jgi:nucleoside-diphosphate-sugar epimerase